jgi:hypothetical protein
MILLAAKNRAYELMLKERIMENTDLNAVQLTGYSLIILGFLTLLINHISVVMGNPWLIPDFLRLY